MASVLGREGKGRRGGTENEGDQTCRKYVGSRTGGANHSSGMIYDDIYSRM